jgi:hypothetical protein
MGLNTLQHVPLDHALSRFIHFQDSDSHDRVLFYQHTDLPRPLTWADLACSEVRPRFCTRHTLVRFRPRVSLQRGRRAIRPDSLSVSALREWREWRTLKNAVIVALGTIEIEKPLEKPSCFHPHASTAALPCVPTRRRSAKRILHVRCVAWGRVGEVDGLWVGARSVERLVLSCHALQWSR